MIILFPLYKPLSLWLNHRILGVDKPFVWDKIDEVNQGKMGGLCERFSLPFYMLVSVKSFHSLYFSTCSERERKSSKNAKRSRRLGKGDYWISIMMLMSVLGDGEMQSLKWQPEEWRRMQMKRRGEKLNFSPACEIKWRSNPTGSLSCIPFNDFSSSTSSMAIRLSIRHSNFLFPANLLL